MLQIKDLTFRRGERVLLHNATAQVPQRHKIGLVGPNGTGKTTLLRLIAGELQPDAGWIAVPSSWRVATVAQDAPDDETSLLDTVVAADRERGALLREAESATEPERIAEIHTRLADIDAHAAPARAAAVLSGLGFDEAAQERPCRALSGGMRMRVALAAVLFLKPELLLLDEPTNHLDLEASLWLESYLRDYPHTVLIVSHDRGLLNRVVDTTLHLDQGKLVVYAGGYDQFERTRRLKLAHLHALQARQDAQRKHLQAFVDRFRYKASKARQAQSRLKAIARMEPILSVVEERTPSFQFPEPEPLSPPLITLEEGSVGYGDRPVLTRLDLRLDHEDRIALLGANGNGKSTLARLLAGRLRPMAGTLRRSAKLRVGYFAQHQAEELELARTALEEAQARMPRATEEKIRAHLGRFGFTAAKAETPVGSLSGGEKARLLLAMMSREAPHILLLDEPTNHLDVDSRQALIQAVNDFAGAVVLITHDPHLIELTADRLWLVAEGTCRPFDGDLADYRRHLDEQRRSERQASRTAKGERKGAGTASSRRDQRRAAAETRATLAPLRREAADAERQMARLEREKERIEQCLADPTLYSGPPERLTEAQIALHEVQSRLAEQEERWLVAQERLEQADGVGADGAA